MIGKAGLDKPAPQEDVVKDKPEPKTPVEVAVVPVEVAPMPRLYFPPQPPAPRIRDVALHTNQGSLVHRYQETGIDTNEWKLIAILTPTDAAMLKKAIEKRVDDKKADDKKGSDAKID
jgi:hypothetical protein